MGTAVSDIICMHDYSFSVGGKRILAGVSLKVAAGEFLSIIGPNGAGKTTLLKCLVRINTGGSGGIFLEGSPLASFTQRALARLVGYVPQSDGRSLPFTAEEFVRMSRYPHHGPFQAWAPDDDRAVKEAFELTGTGRLAGRLLDTLSGGERQTVLIAAALAQETPILLLDEPTAFLDPRHVAEIHCILRRINRRRGVTVVTVTHDINGAALLSDRIVILKDGGVAFADTPREVMRGEVLSRIYEKSFLFVAHPETGLPLIVPEEVRQ